MRFICFLALVSVSCGGAERHSVTPKPNHRMEGEMLTLERLLADPPIGGARIMGLQISPDAKWLTFLRGSKEDSEVLDLWALSLTEKGASPGVLVRAKDILGAGEEQLSEEERMARERKRIRLRGLVSYRFCGEGHNLLFTLGGDLYHVVPKTPSPLVSRLTSDGSAKLDVRCSPKGTWASYVKGDDVYAVDVASKKERRLTRGGTETRRHGVAEFVAQEEMGRYDGHWWSPDERYLAYMDVDLSPVSIKHRPRIHADRTDMVSQRYPATGEANAIVSVRVLDVRTGKDVAVSTPKEDGYIPRVDWFGDHDLYVQWQNRAQTKLTLFRGSAPGFDLESVLTETDDAWLELHNDLRVLKDGTVLWPSEQTGVRQLYRVSPGGTRTPLTTGDDPVTGVVAVNEEKGVVYYGRATDRSLRRHLFRISLAGGEEEQVTHGPGTHAARGHKEGKAFIASVTALDSPPETVVLDAEGKQLAALRSGEDAPWNKLARPKTQWVTVKAEDGNELNGLLMEPQGQEPGKTYPVLVYVYGGPGVQRVVDAFGVMSAYCVYLTQQGFGVFMLDNRGSANRHRSFSRVLKKRVADVEVKDQLAGVAYLRSLPWVDGDRIGVWGWSYGGTMTSLLMTEPNTPFAAGVAGAPVTDWRLYDTHYTERYLGKPQDDASVYERTDVVRRAEQLKKPLLLVHGTADDNVLFENTLRLVEAFQKQSVPFELMIYPGHAHGLRGREANLHLYRTMVKFFARELRVAVDPGTL